MAARGYPSQAEQRLCERLDRLLRRRSPAEARAAGALRVAAARSSKVRSALFAASEVLVSRGSFDRPLYGAAVRALADAGERRLASQLVRALRHQRCGATTLFAAANSRSPSLAEPLWQAAASRCPPLAFGAELARVVRGESRGAGLAELATRLKESSRVELCSELLGPLFQVKRRLPPELSPALDVMRGAERHLGRWLLLARASTAAGDRAPLITATTRARRASGSVKLAWSLLAWALDPSVEAPAARLTRDVIGRLSDRPTADKDLGFLFAMAARRAPSARAMLQGLAAAPIRSAAGVRAASALASAYGDESAAERLRAIAGGGNPSLGGLAIAGLFDSGARDEARRRARRLGPAGDLCCLTWCAEVMTAADGEALLDEARFRRIERGWVE